ncbi:MAG: HD domain-containing protein [Deltaproteobacteria bacterium]|nr:HD domain-containing protein [Deltaproteobacteria bacterium]MBW1986574.1 HD domain-containing protein [Deltaproteobacteria bacterium]MBW2133732.1 HD domain-containing protein [Deltaproteobacteria bacterium]
MQCPGQDRRYWKPGAIFESKCPECGADIEFFKDEPSRRCKNCGHRVLNPKIDFGCASYCKYAEQCLGELSPELLAQRDDLLKDRVAIAMKRYFGQDFRRINHARRVARYAEEIGKNEQGNMAVILCAAYLHDIGIKESERKYRSPSARYQEQEGPPVARQILEQLGARAELIYEVCDIIGHHHHPRPEETVNFKALYDADLIVNLEEQQEKAPVDRDRLAARIDKAFLTDSGRALARRVLLK